MKTRFKVYLEDIKNYLKKNKSEIRNKSNNVRIIFRNRSLRSATVVRTYYFTESKKGEHIMEQDFGTMF